MLSVLTLIYKLAFNDYLPDFDPMVCLMLYQRRRQQMGLVLPTCIVVYSTVHYKYPLKYSKRVGHNPDVGLPSVAIFLWLWRKRRKPLSPPITLLILFISLILPPLDMKGCSSHVRKWQLHPFINRPASNKENVCLWQATLDIIFALLLALLWAAGGPVWPSVARWSYVLVLVMFHVVVAH